MDTVTLKIAGMTCSHCTAAVTKELKAVPGVANVEVSLNDGQAKVTFDESQAGLDAMKEAVEEAGYEVVATA